MPHYAANLDRLYSSRLYRLWGRLLTWFGDIKLCTTPPAVVAEDVRELLAAVQPGDVICRRYDCYLDSHFIPGHYTHSGLVVNGTYAVHAIAEGVCPVDVLDFVMATDGFVLLRPPYQTPAMRQRAIDYALAQIGRPYDFVFNLRSTRAMYCHELSYQSLRAGGIQTRLARDGRVLADDLVAVCRTVLAGGK